jgi:hypothetical protein
LSIASPFLAVIGVRLRFAGVASHVASAVPWLILFLIKDLLEARRGERASGLQTMPPRWAETAHQGQFQTDR